MFVDKSAPVIRIASVRFSGVRFTLSLRHPALCLHKRMGAKRVRHLSEGVESEPAIPQERCVGAGFVELEIDILTGVAWIDKRFGFVSFERESQSGRFETWKKSKSAHHSSELPKLSVKMLTLQPIIHEHQS